MPLRLPPFLTRLPKMPARAIMLWAVKVAKAVKAVKAAKAAILVPLKTAILVPQKTATPVAVASK